MPNYKGAVSYGATGAAIGTSIMPGIGTAIGAAAGFLTGLFGESEEEQRQKRKNELISKIREAYVSSANKVAGATLDQAAFAQQGASRQAAAAGKAGGARSADVAAAVNPVYREGGRVLTALGEQFNQNVVGVETGFAQRPIEPSWGDVLMNAGQSAVKAYTAINEMSDLKAGDYETGEGASPELAKEMTAPAQVQPNQLTLNTETQVNPNQPSFQPDYQPPSFTPTTSYGSNKPEDQGMFGSMQAQKESMFGDSESFVENAYAKARRLSSRYAV